MKQIKDYHLIFNAIEQPIFIHDKAFRIIYANEAYLKLVGKSSNEILDRLYFEIFPIHHGPLQACLNALKSRRWEAQEITTDEGRIFISRSCPIFKDNDFIYSVHTMEDITENKKLWQQIKEDNTNFRTIFDEAIDPFFIIDLEGNFKRANRAACQNLGYTEREFTQMKVFDVEIGLTKKALIKNFQELSSHKPILTEGIEKRKDGTYFPAEIHVQLLYLSGKPHLLAILRDISKRKELEKNLIDHIKTERNARRRLEDIFIKTITAIATMVEKRDPFTAGHQFRVATLARLIAKKMQLNALQVKGIYLGALIHDIGKIHVPLEILITPKQLTREEYQLIQTHAQTGYEIVAGIPFEWPIQNIVLEHHERLDGSGYPSGLVGKDIHLEARIVAVADVFEAMISDRPFRLGLSQRDALNELQKEAGKLYDTRAVACCVQIIKNDGFQFPQVNYNDVSAQFDQS